MPTNFSFILLFAYIIHGMSNIWKILNVYAMFTKITFKADNARTFSLFNNSKNFFLFFASCVKLFGQIRRSNFIFYYFYDEITSKILLGTMTQPMTFILMSNKRIHNVFLLKRNSKNLYIYIHIYIPSNTVF